MRKEFQIQFAGYNNELNALARVSRSLETILGEKGGWTKEMVSTISAPYQWKAEATPTYVDVQNTFSTITGQPGGFDVLACRTGYSTVFTGLRILQSSPSGDPFLDPNDLTKSLNYDTNRAKALKDTDLTCQLYPAGLPVGRAAACNAGKAQARIDLTGTPYVFNKDGTKGVKSFWKCLGRGSHCSIKLSDDNRILDLDVTGRCGDVYGDDASSEFADYRSDPIPLKLASATIAESF